MPINNSNSNSGNIKIKGTLGRKKTDPINIDNVASNNSIYYSKNNELNSKSKLINRFNSNIKGQTKTYVGSKKITVENDIKETEMESRSNEIGMIGE